MTQHLGVACDGCNVKPMIGRRYKCLVCENYDLCENCEVNAIHAHPMMRLMQSTQSS